MRDILTTLTGVGCVILLMTWAFSMGRLSGKERENKNAIADGVAHYEVNPTNGITMFVYGVNTNK